MKVYYSKMNKTPNATVAEEMKFINVQCGAESMIFHNSGVYDESKLTRADFVIVTGFGDGYVGKGVYSEIKKALSLDIPVFQFADPYCYSRFQKFYRIDSIELYDKTDYYTKHALCYPELEDDESDEIKQYDISDIRRYVEANAKSLYVDRQNGIQTSKDEEVNLLY